MGVRSLVIFIRPIFATFIYLIVCSIAVVNSGTALANDQRVLLSFTEAGHEVKNIWYTGASKARIKEPLLTPTQTKRFDPASEAYPESGNALVIWLDSQGLEMSRTIEPDPRLSHAPSHILGTSQSILGGREGAWLITGPAESVSVYIILPGDLSAGLGPERWELAFTGND